MKPSDSVNEIISGEIDPAYAQRARYICDVVELVRPETVLDVGCGRGFYLKLLNMYPHIDDIFGIDLSDENIRECKLIPFCDFFQRVWIKKNSAYTLEQERESIDLVICSEVLEHLQVPEVAVTEIHRVLKYGGYGVFTVPCKTFPFFWDPLNWILMKWWGKHVPKDIHWLAGIWADHERLYTEETLRRECYGFEIVDVRHIVSHCWPFTHFLLYGIGKNLVDNGLFKSLNRFSFEKPGRFKKALANFMALPSKWFDNCKPGVICCITVRKV